MPLFVFVLFCLFLIAQISGRNLVDIVVTVPQTPAHGAVARLQNEVIQNRNAAWHVANMLVRQILKRTSINNFFTNTEVPAKA